jgi:hypothetical protein
MKFRQLIRLRPFFLRQKVKVLSIAKAMVRLPTIIYMDHIVPTVPRAIKCIY